jgi:hypothetical protein
MGYNKMRSMKKCVLIIGCCLIAHGLFAQTWDEWWSQKKTQIKYLTQQIAALETYAGYLQKGYHIAQQGLTAISDIKNGEFNLHKDYFGSLSGVNPAIAKDARIAAIIAMQVSIVQRYRKAFAGAQSCGQFNCGEINYIYSVFTHLLDDCSNDLTELINLTTAGKYQLTDEERIKRLDVLYGNMQNKYAFAQSFSNQTSMMALARMKEGSDAMMLQQLYNVK